MTQKIKYKPDESGFLTQEDTKSYYSRVGMFCFLLGAVSFAISILVSMIIFKFLPVKPKKKALFLMNALPVHTYIRQRRYHLQPVVNIKVSKLMLL